MSSRQGAGVEQAGCGRQAGRVRASGRQGAGVRQAGYRRQAGRIQASGRQDTGVRQARYRRQALSQVTGTLYDTTITTLYLR